MYDEIWEYWTQKYWNINFGCKIYSTSLDHGLKQVNNLYISNTSIHDL